MNFTIKHEIDLSPAALAELNRIADGLNGTAKPAAVPELKKEKQNGKVAGAAETLKQTETTEQNMAASDGPKTIEEVRAIVVPISKAGKEDEVKAILAKFGVKKTTDLKVEQYADFVNQVKALAPSEK
jgi:hypothetical protein